MLGDVTIETVLYIAVSGASVTRLWLLGVQPSLRKLRDARQVQKYSSQSRRRSRQSPPTPDMARVREVIEAEINSRLAQEEEEITLAGQSSSPASDLAALGRSRRRRDDD